MNLPSWFHRFVPDHKARRPDKLRPRRLPPRLEMLEDRCLLSTYTVTNLLDSGPGSLRCAINEANGTLANPATGTAASPDIIDFQPGLTGTISLSSALPALTDIANIEAPTVSGVPSITLDGSSAGNGANGLTISGGSSTVEGLAIVNFSGNGIVLDSAGNTIGSTTASNVISGNGGDGILIEGLGASQNQVINNFIGTNATGSAALGNGSNGIEITDGANRNTIGGNTPTVSGDPSTPTAFNQKPPDGNVISGNDGDGVLITGDAEYNTLSGNFIGTNASGMQAVANLQDGVGIIDADNNSLIGTTFPQPPFVYLNLISGNDGNGLVINDSNNTTVQANSFGLADDNATALGNDLDGVLIEGTSTNTQFGGVIPLGNIVCANGENGIEVTGSASGTVIFNTFCGLPAFVDAAVGNTLDGILITSTGGDNLIRTNVISGNGTNGIEISGSATGVQVAEDIIGMDTNGGLPLPNGANGILIDGNANNNLIGGNQVSVILQNTISSNGGNGIEITGTAYDNQIFNSFIGTDITGVAAYGNTGAGVYIGGDAQDNTIGGAGYYDVNVISGNLGGGIVLTGDSQGTQVSGNLIGTNRNGQQALGNDGDGILIDSSDNQIGGTAIGAGNVIAFNSQDGVVVDAGVHNAIFGNSIYSNAALGILLLDGGNDNQPAPILTAVDQFSPISVQFTGTLTAAANTAYTLEFFASDSGTPSGQGQTFLGSLSVTTNSDGIASFETGSLLSTQTGASFTATATNPDDNTSAFSNAVFAATPTPAPDPPPAPPTPVGQLIPFAFGFGPNSQLELVDVDSAGQVFSQPLGANLLGGTPTFVNSDLIFSNVQALNGLVVGVLQEQGNSQALTEIFNFVNPFVFDAILAAMMKPT